MASGDVSVNAHPDQLCEAPPWREEDRLAALRSYGILDTEREAAFDEIAKLAADIFEAPIAVVNLIADGRQWFKAEVGINKRELPLDVSICRHAVLQPGIFIVPDLTADARFECNPLVAVEGGLRFYAGALLETSDGLPLGTVCVLDTKARPNGISERQQRTLRTLASQAMAQLELRRSETALRSSETRLRFLDELAEATQPLTDPTQVMTTTARLLGEHLSLSVCAYADMDEDEDGFTIRGDWAAPGASSIVGHYSLADFGKLAVKNLSAGLPLVINDNLRELAPEEAATFQSIGITATICMPLVKGGRLVALMAIHDRAARNWTEAELSLLREVTARSWAHVERVGAAAELRVSEARLQRALDVGELGAWELDLATLAAWRSPQHDRIFGYQEPLPDWTYAMFLEHVVSEDRDWVDATFQEAIASGGRWEFECRILRADGEPRWIWAQGKVDAGPDGQPGRMKGMVRDATEGKRNEERLRELNDTLESRVAERTAELEQAHEQLRQSQKLEAMGQLTGGVAHDFNNLLTPIIGSLDMLQRRGVGSEREQRLIGGALESAERAKTLVHRLLAFARRQPLQPVGVDLGTLVEGMADLVASTSGPRVKVELDIARQVPAVRADANQLEMAILNLAVNARDAMPDGGRLTISARPEVVAAGQRARVAPGRYVRLSISDTGVGMDEATLARAIEPFFSTKGVGKGTGLGLSMAHGLASQLGGALTIQSRRDVGTTVEFWLPIAPAAARSPGGSDDLMELTAAGTALLVDDEELARASTADMLSELGYAVIEADSAEEALRLMADGLALDLVVTDHLMPGMTGIDLAREVRECRPDTKVLVISGYAEDEGIALDVARLTKPFRQAELAAKLAGLAETAAC